jgi:hypothetical protein
MYIMGFFISSPFAIPEAVMIVLIKGEDFITIFEKFKFYYSKYFFKNFPVDSDYIIPNFVIGGSTSLCCDFGRT